MECTLAIDGVFALTETRANPPFDRPDGRCVRKLRPVTRKDRGKTTLECARKLARHGLRPQLVKLVHRLLHVLLIHFIGECEARRSGCCGSGTRSRRMLRGNQSVLP